MSKLTEEQTQLLLDGVAQGLSLGEIQSQLGEAGLVITYMDLRFLLDDMGLTLAEKELPKAAPAPEVTPDAQEYDSMEGVELEVDAVVRPGALASGWVRFSDGVKTSWMLDEMGRLGLTDTPKDYRPLPEDLTEFQRLLRTKLESRAF